jgi:hypothetical protein
MGFGIRLWRPQAGHGHCQQADAQDRADKGALFQPSIESASLFRNRESVSRGRGYLPAGYRGRAANGGRWQFCTTQRQTRPIEGRHLPACRDRPGHAGHAAERRSSQNHSTAGHARRRSKCAAEVASRVRCRIHERSAQSSALDDSRLGAPLSLLTCDDCGA